MMIARRTALAATLAALLALTACGGVGSSDSDGGSKSISTMGFGLPDENATARVDAFKKAHSDIKVKINEGGFDQQQFLSAVASGSPPDVVYMERNYIGTYAASGAIQPLDSCVKSENVDLGNFRESAVDQVTYQDKVYGLPDFAIVRVLLVNNTAVKQAGLRPDDVSTTDWTKLAQTSARLAKVSGGKPTRIGFDPKIPEFLPMWVRANGGQLISDDGKSVSMDDPKVVEALTFTANLIKAQGGWANFKAFRDSFDVFGAKNEYAQNQIGASPWENWRINALADASPNVDLGVTPFTDRQGEPISLVTGLAWAIPKGAKHVDEACSFIASMTSTDSWVAAARARKAAVEKKGGVYTGTFTGNKEADDKIFSDVYQPGKSKLIDAGVEVARSIQDTAFALPASPAGQEINAAMEAAVNRVLTGRQTPAQALRQAQAEATQALQKASK